MSAARDAVGMSAARDVVGMSAAGDAVGMSAVSGECVSALCLVGGAASEGLLLRFLPFPFPLTSFIGEDFCGQGERDLLRILSVCGIRKPSLRSRISHSVSKLARAACSSSIWPAKIKTKYYGVFLRVLLNNAK